MAHGLERIFRFCASLKLAVALILSCALLLAGGTVYESEHGSAAAREAIYDVWPLSLLLGAIAVNVMAAAVSRYPWRRKHIGFVITHIGLEVLLLGCLISQRQAVDGSVAISEGETVSAVALARPAGQVYPLPFALTVESARGIETPRGLDRLETRVRITTRAGASTDTVRLNHPLTVEGMTFYQTGFQPRPGENVAVLGMRKDPGWGVKLGGCGLVVGGIVWMFVSGAYRKPQGDGLVEGTRVSAVEAVTV
jgi:hypothetical protein